MRRVILAISLCVPALGCSSSIIMNDVSGPVAACDSFAYANCQRLSECQVAVNVDSCAQLLSAKVPCSSATCAGGTFNPVGAQACLDAYKTQSCQDAQAGAIPAACSPGTAHICSP